LSCDCALCLGNFLETSGETVNEDEVYDDDPTRSEAMGQILSQHVSNHYYNLNGRLEQKEIQDLGSNKVKGFLAPWLLEVLLSPRIEKAALVVMLSTRTR
jgi:hypothetical protein